MRALLHASLAVLVLAAPGAAACPPDCLPGGGAPATDCLVQFGGVDATRVACTDGNPSCDLDAMVNGVCLFPLSACIGVPGDPRCAVAGLSAAPTVRPTANATAQALGQALAALDPSQPGCTAPGVPVVLATSLQGVAERTVRLRISAAAGTRRDRDVVALTCRPSPAPPSLAAVVEPIFASRCAVPACHDGGPTDTAPALGPATAYGALVDVPATNVPRLVRVRPGDVSDSYLAREILGKRVPDRTARMPSGCPRFPPATGCLTDAETAALLAWIEGGAPDN